MNREPEHLLEDPYLREEIVAQESFDEFMIRAYPWFYDARTPAIFAQNGVVFEDAEAEVFQQWRSTLDPSTNMTELLYLQGVTDKVARLAQLDQQHAELKAAAIASGLFTEESIDEAREDFKNKEE